MLFAAASRIAINVLRTPHLHSNNTVELTNFEQAYIVALSFILVGLIFLLIFLVGERRW
jgi:hypothetical protein